MQAKKLEHCPLNTRKYAKIREKTRKNAKKEKIFLLILAFLSRI